jgi:protein phosphatase
VRLGNEDHCEEYDAASGTRLLVVGDEMGGHQGGATASRVAVESIGEVSHNSTADPEAMLKQAYETADDRVYQMAQEHGELCGMGTTCVSLLFGRDGIGSVAHVGDSRAYRLRKGRLEAVQRESAGEAVRILVDTATALVVSLLAAHLPWIVFGTSILESG